VEPGPRLVQALIRPGALASWAVALALAGCATGPALVKAPPPEMAAPPGGMPPRLSAQGVPKCLESSCLVLHLDERHELGEIQFGQ
jgi:hypothetical protein